MKTADPGVEIHPDHAIVWQDAGLFLLDQRVLPTEERFVLCRSAEETAEAIRLMVVRGAPAIGIAAAYGVVLAARCAWQADPEHWRQAMPRAIELLAASRPTAVNLCWALERMRQALAASGDANALAVLSAAATTIHHQDAAANRRMGELGARLIDRSTRVLTHCNAGSLATGGHGTALGVIRSAFAQHKVEQVVVDETRPWLQGARLTAWELCRDGIPVSLIADGAAAARMQHGDIGWVIVGSDRIAANGDVANKIGTYGLAVAARHHGVRFMVVAPTSTVDLALASGAQIPIEERAGEELLYCGGKRVAAPGVEAWNPVFDVTPAALIDAIVTERGVVKEPNAKKMAKMLLD